VASFLLSDRLSGDGLNRDCRLTEEAHQSHVLRNRCHEKLLANKLLEFREQCFHLLSLPLCVREAMRVYQVSRACRAG